MEPPIYFAQPFLFTPVSIAEVGGRFMAVAIQNHTGLQVGKEECRRLWSNMHKILSPSFPSLKLSYILNFPLLFIPWGYEKALSKVAMSITIQ